MIAHYYSLFHGKKLVEISIGQFFIIIHQLASHLVLHELVKLIIYDT